MADIQAGVAMHINDQMNTKQAEKEEIQEVAIQIDDQTEKAEIQEVAIQIDDQLKISIEKSQDLAAPTTTTKLGICMKKMLSDLPGEPFDEREATIFRLSASIHENKKEMCEPTLVAIGPYHHGKDGLQTMEEHKWYLIRKFLARNENVDLEDYLQAIRSIEAKARNCYSEIVNMGSDDFIKMLLLDGCFILEWAFRSTYDILCDLGCASCIIFKDMCLLENQVPFFVLHELWTIQNHSVTGRPNCEDHCPLLELIFPILENVFDFTPFRQPQISCDNIYHLLHLCYLGVVPDYKPQTQCENKNPSFHILHKVRRLDTSLGSKLYSKLGKDVSSKQNDCALMDLEWTIPSISELCDAGVRFKRKKSPTSMFDISFSNGTIEMPFLQIQNDRIRILWNMVAFEQSRNPLDISQTLSSYLALMDTLINTEKDVTILEQSGIFESIFQNAEEAATYFNQFDEIFFLSYEEHYFKGLFQDVREYSESRWPKYRARLMQDYFSNPWAIISIVAAGVLLVLTFVQTYYSAAK